jgi:hypothetical protein
LSAGQDFSAADQDARVDADRPTDQAEHNDRTNAEATASAHRKSETAASAAATVVAAIVDIIAAAEIIVTHRKSPQPAGAS